MRAPETDPHTFVVDPCLDIDDEAESGRPDAAAAVDPHSLIGSILSQVLSGDEGLRIRVGNRLMQRGIADVLEKHVVSRIIKFVEKSGLDVEATPAPSKRAIQDVLVRIGSTSFYVDVKSRDRGGQFSMPNLISIHRLDKLYRSPSNVVKLVMVDYRREADAIVIEKIHWRSIEEICWGSLAIQNIGKGQLQIRNARKDVGVYAGDRRDWIRDLHGAGADFYGRIARKATASQVAWQAKHRGISIRCLVDI